MADTAPTISTTPETTGQAAAAAAVEAAKETVSIPMPEAGETATVVVAPDQTIEIEGLDMETATFTQDGNDVVVGLPNGATIVLQEFLGFAQTPQPPSLLLADSSVLTADGLYGFIDNLDLTAIAPAAGPAAGDGAGGASFSPYAPGDLGPGLAISDLIPPTALSFTVPEPEGEIVYLRGEALTNVSVSAAARTVTVTVPPRWEPGDQIPEPGPDDPIPAGVGSLDVPEGTLPLPDEGQGYPVGNAVTFIISLGQALGNQVTVDWAITPSGGSPAVPYGPGVGEEWDYVDGPTGSFSGTLTFAPGETVKTVTVGLHADATVEGNDSFQLVLTGASGVNIDPASNAATVNIINDDFAPVALGDTLPDSNEDTVVLIGADDLFGAGDYASPPDDSDPNYGEEYGGLPLRGSALDEIRVTELPTAESGTLQYWTGSQWQDVTAGEGNEVTVATIAAGGLRFVPEDGWDGMATFHYMVSDDAGNWSNPAEPALVEIPIIAQENIDITGAYAEGSETDAPINIDLVAQGFDTVIVGNAGEELTSLTLTFSGLPADAAAYGASSLIGNVLTVTLNSDGTLPASFGITLPKDFATLSTPGSTITYTVDAVSNEGSDSAGYAPDDPFTVVVGVEEDLDASVDNVTYTEGDATIPLNLSADITDADTSENYITLQVVFTGLPGGIDVNGGTLAGDTWTGSAAQLGALTLTSVPEDFAGTIGGTLTVTTDEGGSFSDTFTVIGTPTEDIDITGAYAVGTETDAPLNIDFVAQGFTVGISDSDSSEELTSLTLTFSGLPATAAAYGASSLIGNVLTVTLNSDGTLPASFGITLPEDFATESTPGSTITYTVDAVSNEGSDSAGYAPDDPFTVVVGVEEDIVITGVNVETTETDAPLNIDLKALGFDVTTTDDLDSSEQLTSLTLTFSGLPATAAAYGASSLIGNVLTVTLNSDGTLPASFGITLPKDFATLSTPGSTITYTVDAVSDEGSNGSGPFNVVVGVEEDLEASAGSLTPDEGVTEIALDLSADITDADPSENYTKIEVVFTGLPGGIGVNGGTLVGDTWTGSAAQLGALTLTSVPVDFDGTIGGTLTVTTDEGGDQVLPFTVDMNAAPDPQDDIAQAAEGGGVDVGNIFTNDTDTGYDIGDGDLTVTMVNGSALSIYDPVKDMNYVSVTTALSGTDLVLKVWEDGSYEYTAPRGPHGAPGSQTDTVMDDDTFTITYADASGPTVTQFLTLRVEDLTPTLVHVTDAQIDNNGLVSPTTPNVLVGDLEIDFNVDVPGTIDLTGNTPPIDFTSHGDTIFYEYSLDGGTLVAKATNTSAVTRTVFELSTDPTAGTYTITMSDTVDVYADSHFVLDKSSVGGKPVSEIALPDGDVGIVAYITATKGGSDSTLNSSNDGIGVANDVFESDEVITVEFDDENKDLTSDPALVSITSFGFTHLGTDESVIYTAYYTNGTDSGTQTFDGTADAISVLEITADPGTYIDYVTMTTDAGTGPSDESKAKLNTIDAFMLTPTGDTGVEFTGTAADADGDEVSFGFNVLFQGNTVFTGDTGDEVFLGGGGNDELTGGGGDDTFAYQSLSDGNDTVKDFDVGTLKALVDPGDPFGFEVDGDAVDLDVLFDNLGISDIDRADFLETGSISNAGTSGSVTANVSDGGGDFVLTVTDTGGSMSVTFEATAGQDLDDILAQFDAGADVS